MLPLCILRKEVVGRWLVNKSLLKLWPVRRCVTISGAHRAHDEEVKDRLKRRGWDIGGRTNNIQRGIKEVIEGRASIIIVEDSHELPVPAVLRRLITNKVTLLTPIMTMPSQATINEKYCFGTIGSPTIVEKPWTPSRIIDEFEFMILKWSQDDLFPAFRAATELRQGRRQSCIKMLSGLTEQEDQVVGSMAACALALFFRESNLKTAEKILLSYLGRVRKNIGVMLSLVDLYLESAMPDYALRLLKNAMTVYSNPKMLLPDLIQTHLMLGNLKETIPLLQRMAREKYMDEVARLYLPRVLYAEGLRAHFESCLAAAPAKIKLYDEAWSGDNQKHRGNLAS